MEVVKMEAGSPPNGTLEHVVNILQEGGIVCLPCNGTYRLFADLRNEEAVIRLFQSKRRVHKAPSLVFIDSISRLHQVTDTIDPVAKALMNALWPSPLTILFSANPELPRKVVKELTKANGKLGVRIPQHILPQKVVESFGGALLVSSANRGQRSGETSPAQVRKNFGRRVDYFLDAGDLAPVPSSTVIDIENNAIDIIRLGAVSEEAINKAALSAAN